MITASLGFTSATYVDKKTFQNRYNRLVDGLGRQIAKDIQPIVQEAFAPLGAMRYPVDWQSERQRRAYWASDGFGGGIPTRRTGKHQAAWKFIYHSDGNGSGHWELSNDIPESRFIYGANRPQGKYRQRMFNGVWPTSTSGRDKVFSAVRPMIKTRYAESLDSFGILTTGGKG